MLLNPFLSRFAAVSVSLLFSSQSLISILDSSLWLQHCHLSAEQPSLSPSASISLYLFLASPLVSSSLPPALCCSFVPTAVSPSHYITSLPPSRVLASDRNERERERKGRVRGRGIDGSLPCILATFHSISLRVNYIRLSKTMGQDHTHRTYVVYTEATILDSLFSQCSGILMHYFYVYLLHILVHLVWEDAASSEYRFHREWKKGREEHRGLETDW